MDTDAISRGQVRVQLQPTGLPALKPSVVGWGVSFCRFALHKSLDNGPGAPKCPRGSGA